MRLTRFPDLETESRRNARPGGPGNKGGPGGDLVGIRGPGNEGNANMKPPNAHEREPGRLKALKGT